MTIISGYLVDTPRMTTSGKVLLLVNEHIFIGTR